MMATIDSLVEATIVGDNDLLLIDQGGEGKKLKKGNLKIDADNVLDANGVSVQNFIDTNTFKTVADMKAFTNHVVGSKVVWQGYYSQSDGGSNWGVVKSGAHVDDGGSIFSINANTYIEANPKSDRVSILKFGGNRTGLKATDNVDALTRLLAYVKSQTIFTANPASIGGGVPEIYFPAGVYRFSSGVSITGVTGIVISGAGRKATTLIFDGTNINCLPFTNYSDVLIKDMTICAGTLTDVDNKPFFEVEADGARTNTLFDFNSTASGTDFVVEDCYLIGFKEVCKSTQSNVNGDGHTFTRVYFRHSDKLWDNSNIQAVLWTFNNCKVYFCLDLFINNAQSLVVNGLDVIGKGVLHKATGLLSLGGGAVYNDVRMENFQNIDPSSNPKLVVLANGNYQKIEFNGFSNQGGGDYSAKTLLDLQGGFDVSFNNSRIIGIANILPNNALNGLMSKLHFTDCQSTPSISQTPISGFGFRPINLVYDNSGYPSGGRAFISRSFKGALSGRALTDSVVMSDAFYFEGPVSTTTVSYSMPVYVPMGYSICVVGIDLVHWKNGGADITLKLWKDSGKTVKLFEETYSDGTSQRAAKTINASGLLTFPIIDSTSQPLLLEVSSAGNAGTVIISGDLIYQQAK